MCVCVLCVCVCVCVLCVKTETSQVYLPCPPQEETLNAIKKLGPVKVIVATDGHNTYAARWQALFPDAVVLAPAAHLLATSINCPTLAESADLLKQYFVVDVLETKAFTRAPDASLVLEIVGKKCAIMCCGVGNWHTGCPRARCCVVGCDAFSHLRCGCICVLCVLCVLCVVCVVCVCCVCVCVFVACCLLCVCVCVCAVSYTHLTLPTSDLV